MLGLPAHHNLLFAIFLLAHAVLTLNKNGGNRKFILVEMLDYAETKTAERVRKAISGYKSGKSDKDGRKSGSRKGKKKAPERVYPTREPLDEPINNQ